MRGIISVLLLCGMLQSSYAKICGDGPGPMLDVSESLSTTVVPVPTDGHIRDLTILDDKSELLYRNEVNEVHSVDWERNWTSEHLFSKVLQALLPIVDPTENFVVLSGAPNLLDLKRKSIHTFGDGPGPMALYWTPSVHSLLISLTPWGNRFILRRYDPSKAQTATCEIQPRVGRNHRIVTGPTHPFVFLVHEEYRKNTRRFHFSKFDTSCREYPGRDIVVSGSVTGATQEAHLYSANGPAVIKMSAASKNLIFQSTLSLSKEPACQIHSVDNGGMFFLNPVFPTAGTWSRKSDFRLFFLNERGGRTARVDTGVRFRDLARERVAVTKDTLSIFFAPQFDHSRHCELYQVKLHWK